MNSISVLNNKLIASAPKFSGRKVNIRQVQQEQGDLSSIIFIISIFLVLSIVILILFSDKSNLGMYTYFKADSTQGTLKNKMASWFKCDRKLCIDSPAKTGNMPIVTGYDTEKQCWRS